MSLKSKLARLQQDQAGWQQIIAVPAVHQNDEQYLASCQREVDKLNQSIKAMDAEIASYQSNSLAAVKNNVIDAKQGGVECG